MDEAERLTGLVAAILNERELVINLGADHGVTVGRLFKVMDQPTTVRDPASEDVIGEVSREKLRVKVVDLQPRLAVARTYQTYKVNKGGLPLAGLSRDLFRAPEIVTRVRTLRYDESGLDYEPLDEKSSFVKVGDPVVALDEPEDGS